MKTYHIKTEGVYVEIDSDSKLIKNVVNTTIQKTISFVDSIDYYNNIMNHVSTWATSDENTFRTNYDEVINHINNL